MFSKYWFCLALNTFALSPITFVREHDGERNNASREGWGDMSLVNESLINMLTNLKVAFVGFIMKVLYYKGLIIKKAYTFKYFTDYRWRITDNQGRNLEKIRGVLNVFLDTTHPPYKIVLLHF